MASVKQRPNGMWRARYRDQARKEHARHFSRKVDAQRWLDEVTASVVTGQYVDPRAGKMTFKEFSEEWRAGQLHRSSSEELYAGHLKNHVYPFFGATPLKAILPSEIQAWVKSISEGSAVKGDPLKKRRPLAPSTVAVIHGIVSGIFKAAIRDRRINSNPCEGTKLPKQPVKLVIPPTTEQVNILKANVPDRYKALVILAAGTGLRQGEVLGLTVDRLHGVFPVGERTRSAELIVDRQLVRVGSKSPVFGPPKTEASYRAVPLSRVVVDALVEHIQTFGLGKDGLVFSLADGGPISRSTFKAVWAPAARAAGLSVGTGMHALRHYFASLLIRHGESVKTVQARLGHATAGETLDTYSHLWPDSDDRTREAVDLVLGGGAALDTADQVADSVRTERASDQRSA